ncbi:hypothetical protein GCM10026988_00010 [Vibrio panuliri]
MSYSHMGGAMVRHFDVSQTHSTFPSSNSLKRESPDQKVRALKYYLAMSYSHMGGATFRKHTLPFQILTR